MSTTYSPQIEVHAVGASVVDHRHTADGNPSPGAATVGVEVHSLTRFTDDDDTDYVEVNAFVTLVDHSQRDPRGRSGVTVTNFGPINGITERHRTIIPIAHALAAAVDLAAVPEHVRIAWDTYGKSAVVSALTACIERVYA